MSDRRWWTLGGPMTGGRVVPSFWRKALYVVPSYWRTTALDDVVAVVPQRGRKRTLACCAVCFLKSAAFHFGVGVRVDERGLRVSVPEPFGEQGQGHAGLVEVHGP